MIPFFTEPIASARCVDQAGVAVERCVTVLPIS